MIQTSVLGWNTNDMASTTKGRILDVAERLFGDRGFLGTSLRDITAEAKANIASVNYHFGSKEALLAAVLERRLEPINELRMRHLDELESKSKDKNLRVHDIVRAFLMPPFEKRQEWGSQGTTFFRVLGRVHGETSDEFRQTFMQQFDAVLQRFFMAFQRALPNVPAEELAWRMLFMTGSMAFTMSWGDSLKQRDPNLNRAPEEQIELLTAYVAAGMATAPNKQENPKT